MSAAHAFAPEPPAERPGVARREWTGREVMLLRARYAELRRIGCAVLLGRSRESVGAKAIELGLAKPKARRARVDPAFDEAVRRAYARPEARLRLRPVAVAFGCSPQTVRKRASELGLARPRAAPRWAAGELELLERLAHRPAASLVKMLAKAGHARTLSAVAGKLKAMGLSREDPDAFHAAGLAQALGVSSHVVRRWIAKGWLKAQPRRREDGRADEAGVVRIHRREVRAFICANVAVLNLGAADKHWLVDLLTDPELMGSERRVYRRRGGEGGAGEGG